MVLKEITPDSVLWELKKTRKYLKNNELVAVSFDKVVGFCIRKKHTYERKLTQFLVSEQFERYDNMNDAFAQKIEEKKLRKEQLAKQKG